MIRPGRPRVLPWLALLAAPLVWLEGASGAAAGVAGADDSKELVTKADRDLENEVHRLKPVFCERVPADENLFGSADEARAELDDVVDGDNFVLEELKQASDRNDARKRFSSRLATGALAAPAGAMVVGLIFCGCWCCWCWTACCPICRCFEEVRLVRPAVKAVFVALFFVGLGVIVGGIAFASSSHGRVLGGMHILACESAEMLSTTLSGKASPPFVGFLPALQFFGTFAKELRDNESDMVAEIEIILRSSDEIEAAGVHASGVVALFRDMMADPSNRDPGRALGPGMTLQHRCVMCEELEGRLRELEQILSESTASTLQAARAEVARVVSWSARSTLAAQVERVPQPLVEFKDQIASTFSPLVSGGLFPAVKKQADNVALAATICISFLALGYWLAPMLSWTIWLLSPTWRFTDEVLHETDVRHRRSPVNLSLWTWYSSSCCILPAFLCAGFLLSSSVPLSGLCMALDAMNGQMLGEIANGIGLNMTGDSGDMLKGLVDGCVVSQGAGNANMMDILFVRDGNETVGLRESFDRAVLGPVGAAFDRAQQARNASGGVRLAFTPAVASLLAELSARRVDGFVVPNEAFRNDARWHALLTSSATADGSRKPALSAASTASSCDDPAGAPYYGIATWAGYASAAFPTQANRSGTCIYEVPDCGSHALSTVCSAYNELMTVKYWMLTERLFRCDVFEDEDGALCDPKDMLYMPSFQKYTSDCLHMRPEGGGQRRAFTLRRRPQNCTLPEFADYVQQMAARVNRTLDRLARAGDKASADIGERLRGAVDAYFIEPLNGIMTGLTCGFMGTFYNRGLLKGFCFTSVPALRSFAHALIVLGAAVVWLAAVAYVMWRLQVDVVLFEEEIDECRDSLQSSE